MYKKELIIVRHARSKYNIRETTDLDAGITEFGWKQTENVGKFLNDKIHFEGYEGFTSPFLRCLETTEGIGSYIRAESRQSLPRAVKFTVMSELREYLNHSGSEIIVPNRQEERPWHNWVFYPKDGMAYDPEHNEVFIRRVYEAYHKLPEKSIVVTHGLPALMLLKIATETTHSVPVWDHSIDNCSVTYIVNGRIVWRGRNIPHEADYTPSIGGINDYDNFKDKSF